MFKRTISGVLLACIIVPTFFWAKDMITGSVNPKTIASSIYDSAYAARKKILDMATEANRESVEAEYEQIALDIEELEQLLSEADGSMLSTEQIAELRGELEALLVRRESILESNKEQLLAMDKDRLEAERYFLVKLRSEAVKEEWKSITRIARIETSIAQHSNRADQERAAAIVNRFIDAVVDMDIDAARDLATSDLRSELGLARVRLMRRNTPAELETGFELRGAGKNRLEVWAGDKIATLCSRDGTWLFENAWE